jgi:hypothetical protein
MAPRYFFIIFLEKSFKKFFLLQRSAISAADNKKYKKK